MFCSTNHSTTSWRPAVVVNYTTAVSRGNATDYRVKGQGDPNCWGYALEINSSINKEFGTYRISDSEAINKIIEFSTPYVDNITNLNSKTSGISSTSYRIVARVQKEPNGTAPIDAYHFMVQLDYGGWAHKMNTNPSEHLFYTNPDADVAFWSPLIGDATTDTLYFAVNPKGR